MKLAITKLIRKEIQGVFGFSPWMSGQISAASQSSMPKTSTLIWLNGGRKVNCDLAVLGGAGQIEASNQMQLLHRDSSQTLAWLPSVSNQRRPVTMNKK